MSYGSNTYGSAEYAGLLGGSLAVAVPAGTEFCVVAEDRTITLRLQADPVVPFEDREVRAMPSATIDPEMKIKDPGATKDYCMNWEDILEPGETIATSTWNGGGLTASGGYTVGKRAYTFLAGGVIGTVYVVADEVTTSLVRTYRRELWISCEAT